jgi:hypothetical protein
MPPEGHQIFENAALQHLSGPARSSHHIVDLTVEVCLTRVLERAAGESASDGGTLERKRG